MSSATGQARELDLRELKRVCSNCSLKELCVPMGLNRGEVERLDKVVEASRSLHNGDHLFRKGDPMRSIYAVRSGTFKSYVINRDGEEQVIGFHLPGELVGLDAIHPDHHQCSVMALDTASACIMPFSQLSELAASIPGLQRQIMRLLSKEISSMVPRAADTTAEERMSGFLLDLSRRLGERGYSTSDLRLSMPRKDVANYLRLATETVSRVLRRFQDEGWIEVDRRDIRIVDSTALKSMVKGDDGEAQ
ncbi:fumarate/nitrate reduction transcriptional regulator Fnr [Natronospira bacteriovora]|uniref:Fumarate/nitrate reduction transcriptional regulator Fnr n=1 Tax=Natronospira bacteriovora TaxID=3069753 RepID=A0ABU0W3Z1_9GAMM|nr:fumarate/nitrate reduction transcriptional regulator Fnr [Natronospira sp. AB-CW4]MDQ2068687.1 fumarate/nitrate reduction transcriptional regulator Fnr [Natronospira sp. AB-CW4]